MLFGDNGMQILKTSNVGLALALVMGMASLPTLAITPDPSDQNMYQREFKLLDVDSNDKLSSAEIKKDPIFEDGGFGKADKNHNGSLTQDEYATYKSAVQQKEAKQTAHDSAITSKVKTKYLLEKNFRSFKVSVETKDSIVILSGFVDDQATKNRAEQIAAGVKGVKSVKNGLVVKP
jgi:hyperosmotically inducible periplasmic protein